MKFTSVKIPLALVVLMLGIFTHAHSQTVAQKVSVFFDFSSLIEKPKLIIIERTALNGERLAIDTVPIATSKFEQSYKLVEPQLFRISFAGGKIRITNLNCWLSSGSVMVAFDEKLNPVIHLSDSLFNNKIIAIENKKIKFKDLARTLVSKVSYQNRSIAVVEKEIQSIKDSADQLIDQKVYKAYFSQNLNNAVGLYALMKYASRPIDNQRIKVTPEAVEKMSQELDHKILRLPSAKLFSQKITLAKQLSVGQTFKSITLLDTAGKFVNIGEIKGKYLLVDFWANWCAPCRQEHPFYIEAFEKYNKQGFQIISITRDELTAKKWWLKAIREDKIGQWIHLSDFNNIAKKTYDIEFLPTNYLIDPNGIIIARDLRGEGLAKKLAEIFGQQ